MEGKIEMIPLPFYWKLFFSIAGFIIGLLNFIYLVKYNGKHCRFNKDEIHHLYYGWILASVIFFHVKYIQVGIIPYIVAFWMIEDDKEQHVRQYLNPDYRSFLHKLFEKIWIVFK